MDRIASPWPSTAPLAGACLLLMFAGVWSCDGATLQLVALPGGYLSIRFFSLLTYSLALALAWRWGRGPHGLTLGTPRRRRLLNRFVAAGCLLFALGLAGLAVGAGRTEAGAIVCAFLMKGIGPLLSVALLLLFARLDGATSLRAGTIGMAGAFALNAVLDGLAEASGGGAALLLGGGSLCLACASAGIAELIRRRPNFPEAAAANTAPATEPLSRKTLGRIAVGITATALLLGFLREGGAPDDSVSLGAALIVLVVAGGLALSRFSLTVGDLYRGAVVCVAAGFLLRPLLGHLSPVLAPALTGIGCALFEILIWVMSAEAVRNQPRPLRVAALMRLLAVVGHLIGAVLAAAALGGDSTSPHSLEAASLAMVFVYLVMVLFFSRDAPPFAADRAAAMAEEPRPTPAAKDGPPSSEAPKPPVANTSEAEAASLEGEQYWRAPCSVLADTWKLTPRESEVLEQLAQGRDLAFMEERFVLSRNTVKMHVRNVYAKLGVHGKQEVIDLVEATRRGL